MASLIHTPHDRWETVDELTEIASTATKPPPPPPAGIPKQWLPSWVRWPIRVFFLPFVWLDLACQWLARKLIRPPYRKVGHCLQRGNCCHYVLIPEPKGIIGRFCFLWFTQVNGFFLRFPKPVDHEGKKMVVMGCRYLKDNGHCGHYILRPMLCRQWPVIERFGYPHILKGCGYHAVKRD